VVDALERIHAALAEGGVVVDTQPVSARPPVVGDAALGTLDMTDWAQTIAAVDTEIMRTVERGLFSTAADQHIVVTDAYDNLAELVEETSQWMGTRVPRALAERVETSSGPVELHQQVRIRVLSKR
jgi:hypothetical protein